MTEFLNEPVVFFLLIMSIILITPLLSERVRLPGIVGIILGGMLIGPHGFGLIEAGDRIEFLATIGLVYLMFSAGLEVDLHQFVRVRGRALVFGLLTFFFPQVIGMGLGYLLGLNPLGVILLGSAFASHTLIAFPLLTRLGVTRNEAIAVTAGATVLTDIGAFIVLAVVLGARSGGLNPFYFIQLFVLLLLFTLAVVFGLPRLGKLFFQRFSSRTIEFQFVVVVLFISALTAELIGVHEVVGAFLAGLAINATLPRHSPVTGHVLFIGESFFIPVFLLYSGLITDPLSFLESPQTVIVALGVTVVAYLSKLIAAWITARIFKYTKAEFWTVYGLSHAQAAVTDHPDARHRPQYGLVRLDPLQCRHPDDPLDFDLLSAHRPALRARTSNCLRGRGASAPLCAHPGSHYRREGPGTPAFIGWSAGKGKRGEDHGRQCGAGQRDYRKQFYPPP
ncbi:MAG: cation:proton antiporter [Chloroflexota bacterium]